MVDKPSSGDIWTLTDMLEDTVSRHAARPLLLHDRGDVTYGRFHERVTNLVGSLAELGVAHGDRVAVILPSGEELLYLWFALARLGAVIVPINPALVPAEIVPMLKLTAARTLVSDAERLALFTSEVESDTGIVVGEGSPRGTVALEELLDLPAGEVAASVSADDPLCILFTSGTTGRPKGALLTHTTYVLPALAFRDWMRAGEEDRFLACLPLFHMAGQAFAASAVASGGALAILEHFHGSRFWDEVHRHRATLTRYLGQMLAVLCRNPPSDAEEGHTLRAVYGGGTDVGVAEEFERRFGVPVIEGYGLTETNTVLRNELGRRRRGSIGRALPFYEVRIVDDAGSVVPPGSQGEILIRQTPVMMRCYYADPELTRSAIDDGWFHTGDLGYCDNDGWFYFAGRRKNLIRRRGEMISPKALEAVIERHPAIAAAAVVGVPDELGGEEAKAYVACHGDAEVACEELVEWCRGSLAEFEIPRFFEFLSELPRTATHKVNRALLSDLGNDEGRCYDRTVRATTAAEIR